MYSDSNYYGYYKYLESENIKVNYIKRVETNMKLTTIDDVPIAEILMKRRENLL